MTYAHPDTDCRKGTCFLFVLLILFILSIRNCILLERLLSYIAPKFWLPKYLGELLITIVIIMSSREGEAIEVAPGPTALPEVYL